MQVKAEKEGWLTPDASTSKLENLSDGEDESMEADVKDSGRKKKGKSSKGAAVEKVGAMTAMSLRSSHSSPLKSTRSSKIFDGIGSSEEEVVVIQKSKKAGERNVAVSKKPEGSGSKSDLKSKDGLPKHKLSSNKGRKSSTAKKKQSKVVVKAEKGEDVESLDYED